VYAKHSNLVSIILVPSDFRIDNEQHSEAIRQHFWDKGHLICYDKTREYPERFAVRDVKPNFDPIVVIPWIQNCQSNHMGTCGTIHVPVPVSVPVPELRLIDCVSITTVPASHAASYSALSYIWDQSVAYHQNEVASTPEEYFILHYFPVKRYPNQAKSPPPPKTPNLESASEGIADAIHVTKTLGLQYLWVDKYFIEKDNLEKKH
jgi:hypothetical protein